MPATNEFVAAALGDLLGSKAPDMRALHEKAREESPSIATFVDMAVEDLQGAPPVETGKVISEKIKENADELTEAFAKSAAAPSIGICEETAKVIDDFKKDAENEAKGTLEKLLQGIR